MAFPNPISAEELHALDAQYKPFPKFSLWAKMKMRENLWDEWVSALQQVRENKTAEEFQAAITFSLRAAALDTGAIEGLYPVDRGFTISVAMQAAAWEAEADQRSKDIRKFFAAQLQAYELVLDAVTHATPISEAWLRRLHEELCEPQETYKVLTSIGLQEQPLPRGEYKHYPNHVRLKDSSTFAYAPVQDTPSEMHRLMEELRTEAFENAHPVLQASYAHYAFVRVHPFSDGNGRVARALASLYLYRALSIPLVIFADQRDEYYDALAKADQGDFKGFAEFIMDRCTDTIQIYLERLKTESTPGVIDSIGSLKSLYTSYYGLSHDEIDDAANKLLNLVLEELQRQLDHLDLPSEISKEARMISSNYSAKGKGNFRLPVKNSNSQIKLALSSRPPAMAKIQILFQIFISTEPNEQGELLIEIPGNPENFWAKIKDIWPKATQVLEIRLSIWVERILQNVFFKLNQDANKALKGVGYK